MQAANGALKCLGYVLVVICLAVVIPLVALVGVIGWLIKLYRKEHYSDIEQVYTVLSTAHPDKLTGYEISKRVNHLRSDHWWVYLEPGQLYLALEKLLKAGKVEHLEEIGRYYWRARR